MNITEFSQFAIIQTAFLGDVALTLPLADAIRHYQPEAEITFVTTPIAAPLVECSDSVSRVLKYDKRKTHSGLKGISLIADELKQSSIDCIIAPHRSLRTTLLSILAHPKYSIGFSRNAASFLYSKRVNYFTRLHEVERNIMLLTAFDDIQNPIEKPISPPSITIPNFDNENVSNLINHYQLYSPIIAFAPGSVWATKRWCEEYFISTSEYFVSKGYSCVFIGGNEDSELCNRLAVASGAISLAGETSIVQTIDLLKRCGAILTNDSAPTHLAWIAGCPAVTIFGATSPKIGFAPRGDRSVIIQNETLACRPCAIHGGNQCPLGTLECMKSVRPERATRAIENILVNMM
ncbi:MAG: glycosyltransferase family 9 protein [Ignavibacteriae bacterium]|nr:glycosyltransferase family 9 protein [Ignavibacteriota bacterium]